MSPDPQDRVAVAGSERPPVAEARKAGDVDPGRKIDITVTVRPRGDQELAELGGRLEEADGATPELSREELAERHGADPADLERVGKFAQDHGLEVVESSQPRRTIVLRGTIADMSKAFGVDLELYEHPELGVYRGRTGPVYIPSELEGVIEGVFGLDDRPVARPRLRRLDDVRGEIEPHVARAYAPNQVADLYEFPGGADGTGQTVAIIELGGGYKTQDLNAYFSALGISPAPKVTAVGVDGATNHPAGGPSGDDGEVVLDVDVVGAVAPGANIVVYFAPNTTRGFLDAITSAVHDTTHNPTVMSISWGMAEENWTPQTRRAFNMAFRDACVVGISVCAASGDDGSNDGMNDGQAHVDFPAASTYVLACGGTRLESSGSQITKEVVWDEPSGGATGGGVSATFRLPPYQHAANVPKSVNPGHKPGRGVPDVAGNADPVTGYKVRVDGQNLVFGGTSAVAPLYAGLIARINQKRGHPAGLINKAFYRQAVASSGFRDITTGGNGAYQAGPGWDACTGLGSPKGNDLLTAIGT